MIQHFEVSTIMVHGVNGTIVDDGRAILATGLPGAHKAAEALAQGRAVVAGRSTVWSDGDARFVHQVWPDGEEPTAVQFPATYVDLPTGIILSLSAVESRPDMATLGAVGASPRIRRRLAGAQAGFTTGLGVLMGTALGVGFAGVLVLTFRFEFEGPPSQNWALHMPWPTLAAIVLAVPVCAALGAFILTRADLPMTRRLAS